MREARDRRAAASPTAVSGRTGGGEGRPPGQDTRSASGRRRPPFRAAGSTSGAAARDTGAAVGSVGARPRLGQDACQLSDRERFIRAQRAFEGDWHHLLAAVRRCDDGLAAEMRAGLAEHHGLRIPAPWPERER
jgi:hypothetical protein